MFFCLFSFGTICKLQLLHCFFFLVLNAICQCLAGKKKSLNLISEQMLDYNVLGGEKNMLFRNNATKPNNGTLRYGWQVI